jgi:hypothetical protein
VLDPVEGAAQDEQRHPQGGERHADVPAHAAEQVEPGRDAGELRRERAEVREHQRGERHRREPRAEALAHQGEQALAGHDAHARAELVVDDQRRRRQRKHPQQAIAVLGAEDRVRRDPRRVVVGQPGQDARPDHGEQRHHRAAPHELRPAADELRVDVAPGRRAARHHRQESRGTRGGSNCAYAMLR